MSQFTDAIDIGMENGQTAVEAFQYLADMYGYEISAENMLYVALYVFRTNGIQDIGDAAEIRGTLNAYGHLETVRDFFLDIEQEEIRTDPLLQIAFGVAEY